MKKRLLSMLLLVAMIVTALPLVAFPITATETEKEWTEEDYNAFYVTDDALMIVDFFTLNEYWGGTMTFPTSPNEMTNYHYTKGNTDHDFTKVENRLKDGTEYLVVRQKGTDTETWEYLNGSGTFMNNSLTASNGSFYHTTDESAALLKAYQMAGNADATALPEGAGKSFTAEDGYTYYVAKEWNSGSDALVVEPAYDAARNTYMNEMSALLNSYAREGASGVFKFYLPGVGSLSYRDGTGLFTKPFFSVENGFIRTYTPHGNTYLSINGLVKDGMLYTEGLFAVSGVNKSNANYIMLRDMSIAGTKTDAGFVLNRLNSYSNGTAGVSTPASSTNFPTATAPVADNQIFELAIAQDRNPEKYVAVRYKRNSAGTVSDQHALMEDGTLLKTGSAGVPKLYDTKAEALAAVFKASGLGGDQPAGTEFQVGDYYYLAEPYNTRAYNVSLWMDGTQYVDDFSIVSTATKYVAEASQGGNTIFAFSAKDTYDRDIYALRYYSRELTAAERAQNHFADLLKFFKLDLTALALLDAADLADVYAAVADFTLQSDRDEVAAAILAAATAAAQKKYSSLNAAWVALAVQHGLDLSPLMSQPKGLMANTIKFLNTVDPASATIKADYDAALAADLFSSTMGLDDYNALYVQNGLQVAIDYFPTNSIWGMDALGANDAQYFWKWNTTTKTALAATAGTVANGGLLLTTDVHIGNDTGKMDGQAANGTTVEYIFADNKVTTGTFLDVDDLRVYSGSASGDTILITAIGPRDYTRGIIRLPAATEGGELGSLKGTASSPLATMEMNLNAPNAVVVQWKRPAMNQNWYAFNYTEKDGYADVVKPTAEQMGGASMSTTYFYVTHRLVDGALVAVENSNYGNGTNPELGTKHQYAYFMPVFFEKDGARYIVDAIDRTTNNGIGYGSLYATIDAEGNITLSNPDANFYCEETGSLSINLNGENVLDRDNLIFPNQGGLVGGTYLRFSYAVDRTAYAYRSYDRILTEAELAQNHFADIAKYFKLTLNGYEALVAANNTEALAAVHAAVADFSIVTADRVTVQNAVSTVLNSYVDASYEAMKTGDATVDAFIDLACEYRLDISLVLEDARDMSSVYALSFDGLTCAEAQLLLDETYLDACLYLTYLVDATDDEATAWNEMLLAFASESDSVAGEGVDLKLLMTLPYAERAPIATDADLQAAVTEGWDAIQAAVDAFVAVAMEKYEAAAGEGLSADAYNALYVQNGLLLAADFFKYNSYWGAELDAPIAPADNKAYWYDTNKDGEKTEDEIFDLTDPAVAYAPTWAVFKLASNGWSYSDTGLTGYATREEAIAVACEMAGHPAGTAYPEASATNKTGGYVDPEGSTYYVAPSDASDIFKAANLEWRNTLEPAFLNGVTWHAENGTNLFSYTKLSNSAAVQRVRGVTVDFAPYILGEGYFTINDKHDTDGGLQTNINLKTNPALGNDEMTMQMVASINSGAKNISSSVLFLNVRPAITRKGDKLYFEKMDGSSLFKVENANLPGAVEVPTNDVADMTYVLDGIMTANGTAKDCDTLKIMTEKGDLITFKGYYNADAINSTNYIGYHCNLDGSKVYAIRYYNVALTLDEIQQNHFADLAKYFRLDVSSFGKFTAEMKAEVYAAFANYTFENADRMALQSVYSAVAAELLEGIVILEDPIENERFLLLAAAAQLDLAPIENLDVAKREAIASALLAEFNPDYVVSPVVVAYYYAEATYTFSALTFAGYQVRLSTGTSLADYAGVRAVFDVDTARVEEIAKKGTPVTLTAYVLVNGEEKASLTFVFTWNAETEELEVEGTNASASGTTEAVLYTRTNAMGAEVTSFNYTVTFKGEDFNAENVYADFSYGYSIAVGDVADDFSVVSQTFGDSVSASALYSYFADHGQADDAVVNEVVTRFPFAVIE